jgi:hypothetical protein
MQRAKDVADAGGSRNQACTIPASRCCVALSPARRDLLPTSPSVLCGHRMLQLTVELWGGGHASLFNASLPFTPKSVLAHLSLTYRIALTRDSAIVLIAASVQKRYTRCTSLSTTVADA